MKVLVIGNGAREHALLWKLRRDAPDARLYVTRGNGGTSRLAESLPLGAAEIQPLAGWAQKERIDLVVVGPEAPLAAGVVDHFAARGIPIFGPTSAAAEIESSKVFAKTLMARYAIPTAGWESFRDLDEVEAYLRRVRTPVVVKASGLAAGKGAVVCDTATAALAAAERMLVEQIFGAAGNEIVIEEFMEGEELSVFAISDGERVLPFIPAQDHKRIGEGDTGPNTGGMGAYAPVSLGTTALRDQIEREVLRPTIAALAEEGRPFRGLLYAGLMLTADGIKVVEFNCRFGDPETQALLPLLDSSLLGPLLAVARGESLQDHSLQWRTGACVATVLASGSYPGSYQTGIPIQLPTELEEEAGIMIFHAGTRREDGRLVTSGGRVMTVVALGRDHSEASARSIAAAEQIEFKGRQFRRDIGWRERERTRARDARTP